MPAQGTKTIQTSGNYLVIYDYFSEELELSLPKNYIYYTIESIGGEFSKKLFFHILGGFGGVTKTGGYDLYITDAVFTFEGFTNESDLTTFLRNNTAGPTIA